MQFYINMQGKFTFKDPVNTGVNEDIEYIVVAIRSLKELVDSNEDPYKTIYEPIGIGEDIYRIDLSNNVNVIVLNNLNGSNYTYIPETYIITVPDISGYKYVEKLLAINIGTIPMDLDLTSLKEEVKDLIRTRTNLKVEVKEVPISAIELVNEVDHMTYLRTINYGGSREESWRVKYEKLLEAYNAKFDFTERINEGLGVKLTEDSIPVNVT